MASLSISAGIMENKKLGIYLHIPFCIKKCAYCDFCSFPGTDEQTHQSYVDTLCRDIEKRGELCRDRIADTVYFGGGTPTLLSTAQFSQIFEALHKSFNIDAKAEITSECNPATANLEYFKKLRSLGVNRISFGMQSAHDAELEALGRVHRSADFKKAFFEARNAGFENISADVMFGIPNPTRESFKGTLKELIDIHPEHISAYGLILEEGTPFFANQKNLVLPDEETEYTMYADAVSILAEHGYERYEISNFALPGRESHHNMKYWMCDEYVGLGVSAHSFLNGKRSFAPSCLDTYVGGLFEEGSEEISESEAIGEYVMLAMRTARGVEENVFFNRFKKSFEELFSEKLKPYCEGGFVARERGRWTFTDSGFYVSNSILSEIIDF